MKIIHFVCLTLNNNHIFWNYGGSINLNVHKVSDKLNEYKIHLPYVFSQSFFY